MAAAEIPRRDIRVQNLRNNMNLLLVLDCLRAGLSSWWIFSVLDFFSAGFFQPRSQKMIRLIPDFCRLSLPSTSKTRARTS